jgi:cytochrome P450
MRLLPTDDQATASPPPSPAAPTPVPADPTAPDLSFLKHDVPTALRSFFETVARVSADNPVPLPRLQELGTKARAGSITSGEAAEFQGLRAMAVRQGKAVGAVIGLFLRFKPYAMLEEVRRKGALFQPPLGPVLVVEGDAVRDVLARDQEFTVDPYGVEMVKTMSPAHNGGFTTFILSTDDTAVYEPDKRLLAAACNRRDAELITSVLHEDCRRRVGLAVRAARESGTFELDVVPTVARYVPVTLGHRYLGVPVAPEPGVFELTPEMLTYYGAPIEGQAETALGVADGVIPDERTMYGWIKAAFQHFFNNVQKDRTVQAQGLRACRQLLAYLLREVEIQRRRIREGQPVDDTMLARLVLFQMGRSSPTVERPTDLDPRLVSDLRIAENVMGTIVGAVAGQEEATCRVVDSLLRLADGEYRVPEGSSRRVSFDEVVRLSRQVLDGNEAAASRAEIHRYCAEALRLQPQGEVLLRKCAREGAQIAGSRPLAEGTLVFASHGWAMRDMPDADAFILGRPREAYLQYGWNRHACLGQHVSPVVIAETVIALLGLEGLRRHDRFQLDDLNLYAKTFTVAFADGGSTERYWPR